MKIFIKEIKENCNLYKDNKTGIAWIEETSTGMSYSIHPNIDITGSITGMKKLGYWDKNDKVVKSHGYYYNTSKIVINSKLDEIVSYYCECEECLKKKNKNYFTNM